MPTYLNHPIWIRSNHSVCAFYDGDVFGDDVSEAVRECEPLRKLDGGLDAREKMKNLIEHKVAIKLQKFISACRSKILFIDLVHAYVDSRVRLCTHWSSEPCYPPGLGFHPCSIKKKGNLMISIEIAWKCNFFSYSPVDGTPSHGLHANLVWYLNCVRFQALWKLKRSGSSKYR